MTDQLENQLAEVIKSGMDLSEKSGQFVLAQAPELIRQFLMWHTAQNIIAIAIAIIIIIGGILLRIRASKEIDGDSDNILAIRIISVLCFVASASIMLKGVIDLVKISVAPQLYLIEYFIK